ncbi:TAXI family TRAP transporter solute-binding subunit [Chloroflexota bacterium]
MCCQPGGTAMTAAPAFAELLRRHLGIPAVGEAFGGDEMLVAFAKGQAEFMMGSEVQARIAVIEPMEGTALDTALPLRQVLKGYRKTYGLMVRRDSDIWSLEDLRGKSVVLLNESSLATGLAAQATLEVSGLTLEDFKHYDGSEWKTGFDGIKDNRIDAWLYTVGSPYDVQPASRTMELDAAVSIRLVDYGQEKAEAACKIYGGYDVVQIPAGWVNKYQTEPLWSIGNTTSPICLADAPESFIYAATKAIWENLEELQAMVGMFNDYELPRGAENPAIPFHPGAVKYYKEIGVWTPETEARQQALLDQAQVAWDRTH